MGFPDFFSQAPALRLHDGLSELLGTTEDGMVEYRYADAVKLTGHSCPTVAGTWLCVRAGLDALYPGAVPERGHIEVSIPEAEDAGVTGVVGQILTLVTGAAGAGGFKGLGGRYARNRLLRYGDTLAGTLRLRRLDNDEAVEVEMDTSTIPVDPMQQILLARVVQGSATESECRRFGALWQERVRRLLIEHADDPAVVRVFRVY